MGASFYIGADPDPFGHADNLNTALTTVERSIGVGIRKISDRVSKDKTEAPTRIEKKVESKKMEKQSNE